MKEMNQPYDAKMQKTIEVVMSDFAGVRAGRANAGVLDKITVEYYGTETPIHQVASISTTLDFFAPIPVIGPILAQQSVSFLVMAAVVIVGWIVLFKTRFGLRLRMVGENPKAAATMGLRVHGIKYCGVLICGALAGVGGAYLSLDQLDMFVRNMTAGRGYIAVAIAILGRYNPAQIVPCALLFGFCDAVQIYLQGEAFPPQIVQMLPYIVTLLVLAFGVKHIKPPAGVGKYDDE